jgi:predicted RNA-binding protein with PUA-like domain
MAYWVFQANPNEYSVVNALAAGIVRSWHVKQHASRIQTGDVVFIWKAGRDAGIFALATVTGQPRPMRATPQELGHYAPEFRALLTDQDQLRAPLGVDLVLPAPISRTELREHPVLRELSILRMPRGTNFPVTDAQGELLIELARQRGA